MVLKAFLNSTRHAYFFTDIFNSYFCTTDQRTQILSMVVRPGRNSFTIFNSPYMSRGTGRCKIFFCKVGQIHIAKEYVPITPKGTSVQFLSYGIAILCTWFSNLPFTIANTPPLGFSFSLFFVTRQGAYGRWFIVMNQNILKPAQRTEKN